MTELFKLAAMLKEQMSVTKWQSDVLKPLSVIIGILFASFLISLKISADFRWAPIMLAILLCAAIAVFVFSHLYCLLRDRDALRSERHSISKLAIEHGLYGDDQIGLVTDEDPATKGKLIEAAPRKTRTDEA